MSNEFDFDQAMKRLHVIEEELQREDLPLDSAISLFEEGLNLAKMCQDKLASYEQKVKDLVIKHKGE